ncbi:sulfate ABC transporter permease subunit CysW [Termitidicoccus mucosus]|uniref:Sulfate ABC transporter permease n=1 Tax=Termitidicoccus mucosus TaxID=1184151 RepID=A0A178IPE6_9BACT|nr:sulfate ABC transporter permease [Opitutaceae bacterium TSB47]
MPDAAPASRRVSIRGHPRRIALVLAGGGAAALLILLPLAAVFYYALRDGWAAYIGSLADPVTRHAIGLTLLAAAIAVPVNTVFGLAAAWAVAKFEFRGRRLLISLIELPLSISPIVIGVAYLFVFGMQGLLGPWLAGHGIRLVFSIPAIVIVTTIVTTPFVFREVLPLMQSQGTHEEQTALTLGAGGWQTFLRVTLPNIKWALIYGVSLATARSLGEFGSVAIVSGAVRGETNTMTLQIQLLFDDRVQTGAFAVASILTVLALATLLLKTWVEHREARRLRN